ncbi:MAG: hypothetical protein DYG93_05780 [Leptolyngbya sp. PLA2]|nr:hypothetical protein [Leptolyngbya sp.]MCE7971159.1 hypothetical protein [Leptolyngbya sp. PL-A2]MCQ3940838.1 hypothetical protein [cyanobacterium CYA1]MCZ7634140.1 AsmA family protein [Phycisphaerales bacterium]MDL1905153.1 hypothetical protein [Synechococcales cyanobacterium CNB]GIK19298.1 MAG: hypothetical protein BroJett004_14620 [Planctomycetota bacterium]
MRKMLVRLVAAFVVLIVVVVVGGIAAVGMAADSIARRGVEAGATYALGVDTKLAGANVGIMSGSFDMQGLRVANPQGFKSDTFMSLGSGGVSVSFGTLRQEVVELPRLELADLTVNLERADGKANYQAIIDNLKRFESGKDKPSTGEEKRFVIRRVDVRNVRANVSMLPVGGSLTTVQVVVPEIVLTDVGSDGSGVTLGQAANIITKAVLASIAANAGNLLPTDFVNDLTTQLGQLESLQSLGVNFAADFGQGLQNITGSIGDAAKNLEDLKKAGEDATKQIEDAAKGIGNLLGGKKDGGG